MESITNRSLGWPLLLVTALSVSIGWGVRGQFGHEYGAALAGALGGMTIALLSGREDWRARVHYFATLGAVGFAFGGSMSYMKTLAYTHSSDSATVLYGFACILLLGGVWAAPAGAGLGLAAYLDREELTKMFVPMAAIFLTWHFQELIRPLFQPVPFGWLLGSQGFHAFLALVVIAIAVSLRRSLWGAGTRLMVYMGIGAWVGHLLLIRLAQFSMNPPRGDTWAGNVGIVGGILVFCWRSRMPGVAFATLGGFFLGGMGFSLGVAVKLLVMSSGYNTNWHSILEQTQGFLLGLALAVTLGLIIRRAPAIRPEPRTRRWTEVFSVTFVLWLLTYLNLRRAPREWVNEIPTLDPLIYGIPISGDFVLSRGFLGWFDMVFLSIGIAMVFLLVLHLRRPLPFIPATWLGKGQLFYLVFVWAVVSINFMDVLPRFTPIRLVTEWFMTINAAACTVLVVVGCFRVSQRTPSSEDRIPWTPWIRRMVILGLAGAVTVPLLGWGVKRLSWGDSFTGGIYMDHIRFGPTNTNDKR